MSQEENNKPIVNCLYKYIGSTIFDDNNHRCLTVFLLGHEVYVQTRQLYLWAQISNFCLIV